MKTKFNLLIIIFLFIFSSCSFKSDDSNISIFEKVTYFFEDMESIFRKKKTDDRDILYKNIEKNKDKNDKINWIYNNFDNLSETDINLVGNDLDLSEFVYNYNNGIYDFENYDGESVSFNRLTPYYIQWDNRWAYNRLGSSVIGYAGCGPTSISMILNRLNPNLDLNPAILSSDAENYMTDNGIDWSFFTFAANKYGFNIKTIDLDEDKMIEILKQYPLLISVNKGYFTLSGHILVIDSYKNGKFIVNDPNSIKNSEKTWTFNQLKDEIANIWLLY
ncbi:C39 family peptidase [Anaerococcus sp. AGMB00486]|uniref:C39 family peptidase n=1 Tax=Anaerococcus faecalis TaxID=2742993 RepID=A0ABX2N7P6_9FIRM|nr:C39 family peptidase [Anaerococcus faecalis]NVF10716.1 C39 family peptidase [Anaerococcus faecalis]